MVLVPVEEVKLIPESAPERVRAEAEALELVRTPDIPIVVMLEIAPAESILRVPEPDPVLIPVVPLIVVPVIVFAVAMVPKPEAIEPEARAPVPVILPWTAVGSVEEIEGTPVPEVMRTPLFPVVRPWTVLAPFA